VSLRSPAPGAAIGVTKVPTDFVGLDNNSNPRIKGRVLEGAGYRLSDFDGHPQNRSRELQALQLLSWSAFILALQFRGTEITVLIKALARGTLIQQLFTPTEKLSS
jgi:hypothetical protein